MYARVKNTVFSWGAVCFWAALILAGSVLPVAPSGSGVPGADKIAHFSVYAVLAVLISGTMAGKTGAKRGKILLFTLLSSGVYGILMELVQAFIPYRKPELQDVFSNCFGVVFGLIISRVAYGGNKAI